MNRLSMLASVGLAIVTLVLGATPIYAADCPHHGDMISATIDVKPGSDLNPLNLKSRGVIPVALLGSLNLSATDVDLGTVQLHPMGRCEQAAIPARYAFSDVNRDGHTDIVFHFMAEDVGLQPGDTAVCLHGYLNSGQHFCGHDGIVVVGVMR